MFTISTPPLSPDDASSAYLTPVPGVRSSPSPWSPHLHRRINLAMECPRCFLLLQLAAAVPRLDSPTVHDRPAAARRSQPPAAARQPPLVPRRIFPSPRPPQGLTPRQPETPHISCRCRQRHEHRRPGNSPCPSGGAGHGRPPPTTVHCSACLRRLMDCVDP